MIAVKIIPGRAIISGPSPSTNSQSLMKKYLMKTGVQEQDLISPETQSNCDRI